MARRPRPLIEGGIYHITSRGNERGLIFRDALDRTRFLGRLQESAETYRVRIFLYCLMDNHVHLLLETPRANLGRFMGSLLTGYTVYFNRRHERAGHLMQGRYGAQVVEGDEYLLRLSRYIHLNPVHTEARRAQPLNQRLAFLRDYPWSSYGAYAGTRTPPKFLQMGPILGQLPGRGSRHRSYRHFIEAGLAESDKEFVELMGRGGIAIGSEDFEESVKEKLRDNAARHRTKEDISFRHIRSRHSADEVERALETILGAAWGLRKRPRHGRDVRSLWALALHQYAEMTQREIAARIGVGTGAAICHLLRKGREQRIVQQQQKKLYLIFKG